MLDTIDIQDIVTIARTAGQKILEIYETDFGIEYKKEDDYVSPLTEADTASNDIILSSLKEKHPNIPILSEESKEISYAERKQWTWFWLVDPLDGTKDFIKKNGNFTVNIALIHNSQPVLGVVYAPAKGTMYYAKKGEGSYKQAEQNTQPNQLKSTQERIVIVASKSHPTPETEHFLEKAKKHFTSIDLISVGSSLKFCLVAEGTADIYPRLGPTMEWDTAAAQAVLEIAGGTVRDLTGNALCYNKENLLNPHFIATRDIKLFDKIYTDE